MSAPVPEEGKRRIKITVPDVYKKVDDGVWSELEKYVFTGFLHSSSVVQGRTFVFKTLNANEVRMIEFMRPYGATSAESRASFRSSFIAHSVLMADGQNVLHDRPNHIVRLMKLVGRLPVQVQNKVVENLSALNERASRLFPLVEPYSYENRSRYKWLQVKGQPINASSCTGIPGTDDLGMNYCQQVWTAMNNIQDLRDSMEKDWSHAKFIGSCFAGKSIRSIDEKDKMRHEKERVDREEAKMLALHAYLNRLAGAPDPTETVRLPDGRQADVAKRFRADSVEELADQLSAALSGEKDFHDTVVEARERGLRDRAAAIEDQKRLYFSRPRVNDAQGGGSRIIGGRAEADAYLARMEAAKMHQLEMHRRVVSPGEEETSDGPLDGGPKDGGR